MAELLNTFLHDIVFTTENTNNLPDINNILLDVDSEKLWRFNYTGVSTLEVEAKQVKNE